MNSLYRYGNIIRLQNVRYQSTRLTDFSRGTGGRSSFNGMVCTVFGATGSLGRYVVNSLCKIGSQVIAAHRDDPIDTRDLKVSGDLGQVLQVPIHLRDEASLRKAMKYSNVVVNLIAKPYKTKNFTMRESNVESAETLARVAREMGVERFIHVSSVAADVKLPTIFVKNGSELLRNKAESEILVRNEFPDATILRLSDVIGPEDKFSSYYGSPWRYTHKTMPLWKQGKATVKMPILWSDAVEGITAACQRKFAIGKTFEVVGPRSYILGDLIDYMFDCMRWGPSITKIPIWASPIFLMKLAINSQFPLSSILSIDKLDREHQNDRLTGLHSLHDLGITPKPIESRLAYELLDSRKYMHYLAELGEFPDPTPPPFKPVKHNPLVNFSFEVST